MAGLYHGQTVVNTTCLRYCTNKLRTCILLVHVAQMVEVLRYKPEGRGFDYRFILAALWSCCRLSL
jgi:hypothetical protein